MGYSHSPFRDFERYLRNVVSLDEDDIQLILKQNKSHFFTYELPRGNFLIKDFSEIVYTNGDRAGTLELENDEISMKTKLVLKQFRGVFVMIGTLKFDGNIFKHNIRFPTILGLQTSPYIH